MVLTRMVRDAVSARPAVIAAFLRTAPGFADTRPDEHLLADFFTHRDEAAFTEIVRRHQRSVWGVCRRVLVNLADAEDAFQATFLVLARRGRTLADRGSVGGWLYRVALRVSLKARAMSTKRRIKECMASRSETAPEPVLSDGDLLAVIGEELDRLPENDRLAVIVCDLDGLSRSDAATRLGWNEGTLSARLHRARKKLAAALTRRGIQTPLAAIFSIWAVGPISARAAELASLTGLSTTVAPESVAALVHSTLREMTMRITSKALATLCLIAAIVGTGWVGMSGSTTTATAAPVPEKPAADKTPELPLVAYELLHNRKVLKELKCTAEQRVAIEDYFDDLNEKAMAGGGGGPGIGMALPPIIAGPNANPAQIKQQIADHIKSMQEAQGKIAKTAAEKHLTGKQIARLGQIEIQQRGIDAFSDEKLVANLKLTKDQLKVIEDASADARQPAAQPGAGGGLGGFVFQATSAFKDAEKEKAAIAKVEAALTKEQMVEWNKLIGEKVKFQFHPHMSTAPIAIGFQAAPALPAAPLLPPAPPPAPIEKK